MFESNTSKKVFDENEEILLNNNFERIKDSENRLVIDKMVKSMFLYLPINKFNLISFLNDYYQITNSKSSINHILLEDYFTLTYILTKYFTEEDSIYLNKSLFYIIYDIIKGKIGSFDENYNKFEIKTIENIFEFMIQIFIERHENNLELLQKLDKEKLSEILQNSIMKDDKVDNELLNLFLSKLVNLDSFLKNYFKLKFMGIQFDNSIITSIPMIKTTTGMLTVESYFLFAISNQLIYNKKFGYKLFDASKDGMSIPTAIYSFLGFKGSVAIFIHHFDKEKKNEYIIGAYINSNFRDSVGYRHCGDENSFIFSIYPKFSQYKFVENPDKVCYLLSRNIPPYIKKLGIGLGSYKEYFKLWIDGKDLTNQSYFLKFDDVFEEGSPFKESQTFLNIINMEIFGFGDEEDLDDLMKIQEKERKSIENLKKINRTLIGQEDFDKDIFLSETFAHQQYGKSSQLDTN